MARGALGVCRDIRIAEQGLRPLEHILREDLQDHDGRHEGDRILQTRRELGESSLSLRATSPHHHPHEDVVGNLRLVEPEIARGLPHLLVSALVAVARLVARVRLEEPTLQVGERGPGDVLLDRLAQVRQAKLTNASAEALDDRDDGERARNRLHDPFLQEELRLWVVRVVGRNVLRGDVKQRLTFFAQSSLPAGDRGSPVESPRGVVLPSYEAPVAADPGGEEGLVVPDLSQQLVARELELPGLRRFECLLGTHQPSSTELRRVLDLNLCSKVENEDRPKSNDRLALWHGANKCWDSASAAV